MGDGQEPRLIFFIQDAQGQGTFYPAVLSPQYASEMIARQTPSQPQNQIGSHTSLT